MRIRWPAGFVAGAAVISACAGFLTERACGAPHRFLPRGRPAENNSGRQTRDEEAAPALPGIKAVLFDLDQTLIDRRTANLGRGAALLHRHRVFDGERLTHRALDDDTVEPNHPRSAVDRAVTALYHRMQRHVYLDAPTRCVLAALRQANLPFGIVTNGTAQKRHTIHLLDLDRMTACIFVSATFGRRKPAESIFAAAAGCLGVAPEDILFVGDKPRHDIRGARRAGMKTAWLRRGATWRHRGAQPGADVILTSIDDLLDALGVKPD